MKEDQNSQEFLEPDSDLVKAMDAVLEKKNPKLAALVRQGVEQVEQDRAQGRFRPLR
jgi:hypothetical protein